jgi:hypothetical protein
VHELEKEGALCLMVWALGSGDSDSDPLLGMMSVASTAWTAVVTCDCSCGLRASNECRYLQISFNTHH